MKLIGVDGCRAGWVAASCDVDDTAPTGLAAPTFAIWRTFGELLASLQEQRALVAVDIPIGLASGTPRDDGRRRVDGEARKLLGSRRGTSVFSAPCRPTLAATSHREACELEVGARGARKGLSQQSYNIIPKIREVDAVVTPTHQAPIDASTRVWVREVHPEVSFAMLSLDGRGLVHPKRGCRACRSEPCSDADVRLILLRPYVPSFDPVAERQRLLRGFREQPTRTDPLPVRGVPVGLDDVVDAVACLVTACRIVTGKAQTLPADGPEKDVRGLRMEIVS